MGRIMKSLIISKTGIVLLLWGCMFLFSSCKQVKDEPKSVAQFFVEAIVKEDFEEASKYATKDSQSALEMLKSAKEAYKRFGKEEEFDIAREFKGKKIEYSEPQIQGEDRAIVNVLADGKEKLPLILVRENDSWKIAFDKATIMDTERK